MAKHGDSQTVEKKRIDFALFLCGKMKKNVEKIQFSDNSQDQTIQATNMRFVALKAAANFLSSPLNCIFPACVI